MDEWTEAQSNHSPGLPRTQRLLWSAIDLAVRQSSRVPDRLQGTGKFSTPSDAFSPATFARDARLLADGGYRLTQVTPVDQFRYSPHIELVARFTR